MKVGYELKLDGKTAPVGVMNLVRGIEVTDELGFKSDTIRITLDDSDQSIRLPEDFVTATVNVGYEDRLESLGTYKLDEIRLSSDRILVLSGKAFDTGGSLKTIRSRSFSSKVLGDVVLEVAKQAGLKARVDSEVSGIEFEKAPIQRRETDLLFLQRVCEPVGCGLKVIDGTIVVTKKATGKSISGRELKEIALGQSDVESWEYSYSTRERYKSASARVYSIKDGKEEQVSSGSGEPEFKFPQPFSDKVQAENACAAKIRETSFRGASFTCSLQGDPRFKVQTPVRLRGFRKAIDGPWFVKSVRHNLDSAGFQTELTLVQQANQ